MANLQGNVWQQEGRINNKILRVQGLLLYLYIFKQKGDVKKVKYQLKDHCLI